MHKHNGNTEFAQHFATCYKSDIKTARIGCDPKTLRKFFRKEIKHNRVILKAMMVQSLVKKALGRVSKK